MERGKTMMNNEMIIEDAIQDELFIDADAYEAEERWWIEYAMEQFEKKRTPVKEKEFIDFEEIKQELPF